MPNYKKFDSPDRSDRPGRSDRSDRPGRSGGDAPRKPSLLHEIRDLDERLISMISRRNTLMGKAASKRKLKGLPLADPDMERRIFEIWTTKSADEKFNLKAARRVFEQLNTLAYTCVAKPENRNLPSYSLSPPRRPVKVTIDGPCSLFQSQLWIALAAMCSADAKMSPLSVNDQLTELAKAFNQAGAHISWENDTIESRSGEGVFFEDKLVFAGDDEMTLYLILAFGLKSPGKFKIAGGPILKQYDSRQLTSLLSPLGARLNTLDLQSHGLPARLECGGNMVSSLTLTEETPPKFAAALTLAGWTYPQGMNLKFDKNWAGISEIRDAVEVLNTCGIKAVLTETECTVPFSNSFSFPEQPNIALDPELSAALLSIPAFAGGNVTIKGTWPKNSPKAKDALKALTLGGLVVKVSDTEISSTKGEQPQSVNIDFGEASKLFPIGIALAVNSGTQCSLQGIKDVTLFEQGIELLERLGLQYARTEDGVQITPGRLEWEDAWTAPTPYFGIALGLMAWIRPGLSLLNPGDITELWPRYWTLYNSLPEIDGLKDPEVKELNDDAKSNRRRIKID
ncbi:chorismate mutase [Maridesulfovibrio ferrireducens]|uniref:chorismate mutase n=1 Tax=Maridesulfovibrio ferrireducens TaxID=246191 RepID=UPI001A2932C8|nr:chorismate mutase [Maridesulfovibrio ferrireducens]MBI9112077.1 chorismate mutase [Maridesulfovibrio ferrireducens]